MKHEIGKLPHSSCSKTLSIIGEL